MIASCSPCVENMGIPPVVSSFLSQHHQIDLRCITILGLIATCHRPSLDYTERHAVNQKPRKLNICYTVEPRMHRPHATRFTTNTDGRAHVPPISNVPKCKISESHNLTFCKSQFLCIPFNRITTNKFLADSPPLTSGNCSDSQQQL